MWWYTSVFPALMRWRREDQGCCVLFRAFEASLGYMSASQKIKIKIIAQQYSGYTHTYAHTYTVGL